MEGNFTKAEVIKALKAMHPSKAPGPDGFHAAFFQRYWHVVGEDVAQSVLNYLNNGKELKGIN